MAQRRAHAVAPDFRAQPKGSQLPLVWVPAAAAGIQGQFVVRVLGERVTKATPWSLLTGTGTGATDAWETGPKYGET